MFFRFLFFFILFNICIDISFSAKQTFQKQVSIKERKRENEARKKSIEYHTNELKLSQNNLKRHKGNFNKWSIDNDESSKFVPAGHTNREKWLKLQKQRNKIPLDSTAKPLKLIALLHTNAHPAVRQIFSDRADIIHSAYQNTQQEMENLSKAGKHDPTLKIQHQQQSLDFLRHNFIIPRVEHESDIRFHKDAIDSHQKAIDANEERMRSQSYCKIISGPISQKQISNKFSNKERKRENEARKKSIEYHTNELKLSQSNLKKNKEDFKKWTIDDVESEKFVPAGHTNRESWLKLQKQRNSTPFYNTAKPLKLVALLHTTAPPAARKVLSDRADMIHSAYQDTQQQMNKLSKAGKHDPNLVTQHELQDLDVIRHNFAIPGAEHESDIRFHKDAIKQHRKAIIKNEEKMRSQSHCRIM